MPATNKVEFKCDLCASALVVDAGSKPPEGWLRIALRDMVVCGMVDSIICPVCLGHIDRVRNIDKKPT